MVRSFWFAGFLAGLALLATPLVAQSEPQLSSDSTRDLPVVLRTRTSTHYRLPDGTTRAVITVRPHNYRDAQGQWHEIREVLAPGADAAWQNLENGLMTRFPNSLTDGVAVQGHGFPELRMRPRALVGLDAFGDPRATQLPQAAMLVKLADNRVQYPGLFPGVADDYIVGPDRLKHNLIITEDGLAGFEGSTWFGGEFTLEIPAGFTVVERPELRVVELRDASGRCIYELGAVDATDAAGEVVNGELRVRQEGNLLHASMLIPMAWASDRNRVFPIELDPTLLLQPDPAVGKDTHIRANSATTNYGTGTSIGSNYGTGSGWLTILIQFDVSTIPSSNTVTAAQMELYHWGNTGQNHTITSSQITSAWTESTVNWNTAPTYAATPATSMVYPANLNVWRIWTGFTTLTQSWVSGSAANHGIYMINTGVGYEHFHYYHYSSDYTTTPTQRPRFIVDYMSSNPPVVTGVSPGTVNWGQTLTITGTDLAGASSVTIGGTAAAITSNRPRRSSALWPTPRPPAPAPWW